ncbi:hypothetical protein L3i20_v212360 [Paenibacillus sp. L3-i20]|nr:hypothetical protein L3i20_v212360 [Paenibacillus sp. L3-i20]
MANSGFDIIDSSTLNGYKGGRLPLRNGGMPMEVKDTLTLMIGFGGLLIALLTLIVAIVIAFNQKK